MTAEVAVMNKLAVALAADSAVTGSFGKIYDTVDKLFALDHCAPVALMVNGSAEYMGIPWETVVKLFRKDRSHPRAKLRDYVNAFLQFLTSEELLQEVHIDTNFSHCAQRILHELSANWVDRYQGDEAKLLASAEAEIAKLASNVAGRKFYASMSEATADALWARYSNTLREILDNFMPWLKKRTDLVDQLGQIYCLYTVKEDHHDVSGVVIAGYGETELYPSVVTNYIAGTIYPRLLRARASDDESDSIGLENDASIIPFAQAEMVHTFMNGVDPEYARTARGALKKVLTKFSEFVAASVPLANEHERPAFKDSLKKFAAGLVREFHEEAACYSAEYHQNPVIQAVGLLPKDQLATMAESLVSLTSFRRRMSSDSETVGGAVDVAVVSKGDGFVWIKRKHYFDPAMNPRYIQRVRGYCSQHQP